MEEIIEIPGNFGYIHNCSIKDKNMFDEYPDLTIIYLDGLNQDISFKNCLNIQNESLEYLVSHSANTEKISVVLPEEVYSAITKSRNTLLVDAQNKNIEFITE